MLFGLLLAACEADGALLAVDLRTDFVLGEEMASIDLVAVQGPETVNVHARTRSGDGLDGIRIAEVEDVALGLYRFRATGRKPNGEALAETEFMIEVRATTVARILLTRDCAGVQCPEDDPSLTACLGGRCENPRCVAGDRTYCADAPECTAGPDCEGALVCGGFECFEGSCVVRAGAGECPADAYCEPERGCRPRLQGSGDAGTAVDAGPGFDAGETDGGADGGQDPDGGEPAEDAGGVTSLWPERSWLSRTPTGGQSVGTAVHARASADGRVVCFHSDATDLLPGVDAGHAHVYVARAGEEDLLLASIPIDDATDSAAFNCTVSADGSTVVFRSGASDLVPGDTNGEMDVFAWTEAGGVERMSVSSTGAEGNGQTGTVSMAGDGRWVVFESDASNLVADDTNGRRDVFLRDRDLGETMLVSVAEDGAQGNGPSEDPSISDDGRYVLFSSEADNLVADDTNGRLDMFVVDRTDGSIRRILGEGGAAPDAWLGRPHLSPNGRFAVFHGGASNLVPGDGDAFSDVFIVDLDTDEIRRASAPRMAGEGASSYNPTVSNTGRVIFESNRATLTPGDGNGLVDVFVYDWASDQIVRVSVSHDGSGTDGRSSDPGISADGRWAVFQSEATGLLESTNDSDPDVYLFDLAPLFD